MSAGDSGEAFFPDPFPPSWASDWGEDDYGLWMALTLDDVRQVFRWIAPGRFVMGSPEDEPERYDDETPHEVTLSRGYWLADTACTQAMWQAVMGENPSRFRDDARNPVENVSWNEVQAFIGELEKRVPGLTARLPSEAEWEYACRAGTTTPFSFGEDLTPERVNYDGNYPYAGGKRARIARRRCRWARCRRTPGVCTRCTATSGNGVRISMTLTRMSRKSIRRDLRVAITACCAAARGSAAAGTCVPPTVSGTSLATATTTSGSGSP